MRERGKEREDINFVLRATFISVASHWSISGDN